MSTRDSFLVCTDVGMCSLDGDRLIDTDGQVTAACELRGTTEPGSEHPPETGLVFVVGGNRLYSWSQTKGTTLVAESRARINCVASIGGRIFAGTEKARVAAVKDGALEYSEAFDSLPGRSDWDTPWGGPPDLRSFAVAPNGDLYADIHVGWIARSTDGGATWAECRTGLEKDVHQVATRPDRDTEVFAATARGFHLSDDAGATFERRSEPMPFYYQRACAAFPETDTYLVSTSKGPYGSVDARLFRTVDAGRNWSEVSGLPSSIEQNIDTFHLAVSDRNGIAVVVAHGRELYCSEDYGEVFEPVEFGVPSGSGSGPGRINAVIPVRSSLQN